MDENKEGRQEDGYQVEEVERAVVICDVQDKFTDKDCHEKASSISKKRVIKYKDLEQEQHLFGITSYYRSESGDGGKRYYLEDIARALTCTPGGVERLWKVCTRQE